MTVLAKGFIRPAILDLPLNTFPIGYTVGWGFTAAPNMGCAYCQDVQEYCEYVLGITSRVVYEDQSIPFAERGA